MLEQLRALVQNQSRGKMELLTRSSLLLVLFNRPCLPSLLTTLVADSLGWSDMLLVTYDAMQPTEVGLIEK